MAIIPRWQTPISRWAFDGNVNDAYGLYNCTSSDTTYTTDCKQGSMAKDSGTANLPVIIYSSFSTYSISMWFRNPGSLLYQYKSGSTFPRVNLAFTPGENRMYYYIHSGAGTVIFSDYFSFTDTSNWHHIVITDTGGTVKGYLDGSLTTISGNYTPQVLDLNTSYFSSDTDDARLYDVALTADEVMNLYKSYATPIWQQPLHHWKLDGDATDSAGDKSGTAVNMSYSSAQKVIGNYSGSFNSSSPSYITIDDVNPIAYTNFTTSFWVKANTGSTHSLVHYAQSDSTNDRISMHADSGSNINYYVNSGGTAVLNTVVSGLIDGTWHHYCAVDANGSVSLYRDGIYITGGSYTRFTNACDWSTIGNLRCQGNNPHASYRLNGSLDDVRLYDVALSASDVKALYSSYFTEKATNFMSML